MHSLSKMPQNTPSVIRTESYATLVVCEAEDGLVGSKTVEAAFLCLSLLTIFCAAVIGITSIVIADSQIVPQPFVTSAGLVAAGLLLYAFGTRGFRRQVIFNSSKATVTFGRINGRHDYRIKTELPLHDIVSMYVEKSKNGSGSAALMLRTARRQTPVTLLTGRDADLRRVHEEICQLRTPARVAPVRNPRVRRLRPQQLAA